MRIENEVLLDYSDVLIRPKRSTLKSRREVDLNRKFTFRNFEPDFPDNARDVHYFGTPIMASNMDGVGTMEMADKLAEGEIFTCLVKTYTAEELIEYFDGLHESHRHVAMSIGTGDSDYNKLVQVKAAVNNKLKYVCIDIANGYSEHFVDHVRKVRENFSDLVIIAGNVVTADQTQELILNGADIVKVGIGPGSVCTTRIQTGVGYPQLSAVMECADAAHGLGGHIIADGGCTCPGDVAKAFATGADFVMLGGMLAGHDEGGGEVIEKFYKTGEWVRNEQQLDGLTQSITWEDGIERKRFVQFYGMSSESANDKHFGGLKDYRSSEGRTVLVPYRGAVARTIQDILGGLRSACTYAGAVRLKHLSRCTTFVRCTQTHNGVYEASTIGK